MEHRKLAHMANREAVGLWTPLLTAMPPILPSPCALPFLQALVLLEHLRSCWGNI